MVTFINNVLRSQCESECARSEVLCFHLILCSYDYKSTTCMLKVYCQLVFSYYETMFAI